MSATASTKASQTRGSGATMTNHREAVIDPGSRGAFRRLLIDFDTLPPAAGQATKALPVWFPIGRAVAPVAAVAGPEAGAPQPVSGIDASARDVAAAVAAALAEAEAEHAADRAALETDFVERLAAERASWVERQAGALASGLRDGYGALEEVLAEATAAVLEPFLDEAARASAITGLRSAIVSLTTAGPGAAIAVNGPQDLIEALRKALDAGGGDTRQMSFTASDACEVTVVSDSSTIRTRLGDWTRTLQGCLGGQHE